jgi:hypothetical protein
LVDEGGEKEKKVFRSAVTKKRFFKETPQRRREKSTWQGNEEKANKGMKMTRDARSSSRHCHRTQISRYSLPKLPSLNTMKIPLRYHCFDVRG